MLSLWIGTVLILAVFLFRRLSSPLAKVPGPWYTNVTSLFLKYHELTSHRRVFVHQLHQTYGPAVRLSPNEISFTSLEAVKEIYASAGSGYDKTEYYDLFRQYGIKTMFSTLDKAEHRKRKRVLAEPYLMTNIVREKLLAEIRECAHMFVSKCTSAAGASVDVYVLLHCYALDCVSHFLFSPRGLNSLESATDLKIMEELTYHQSLQKNLLHYYLPKIAPYLSFLRPRHAPLANEYVIQTTTRQQDPADYTLVERLTNKESPLQPMQAAAECKDHMAAGIDTTGDGLCFLMWELSQPQHWPFQQRLQQELLAATKTGPHEDDVRALDSLPYLDAVVKEALRIAPPIPMSLPRYVPPGGRTIEDYFVPAGTIVSCQAYSVHRLNADVFPEPDRFNPDRWLDSHGVNERNRLFFAFATGARGCTGKNLALVEMKILLREVYSTFTTSVAADMTGCMEIDDQIISSRPKDQTCKLVFTSIQS